LKEKQTTPTVDIAAGAFIRYTYRQQVQLIDKQTTPTVNRQTDNSGHTPDTMQQVHLTDTYAICIRVIKYPC
jgi:hypothetical protein